MFVIVSIMVMSQFFLESVGPRVQINKIGFDQIRLGMAQQKVEDILGGPPNDYGPESYPGGQTNLTFVPSPKSRMELWIDGHCGIYVVFDENRRVEWCDFEFNRFVGEESLERKLLRWIRLAKRSK